MDKLRRSSSITPPRIVRVVQDGRPSWSGYMQLELMIEATRSMGTKYIGGPTVEPLRTNLGLSGASIVLNEKCNVVTLYTTTESERINVENYICNNEYVDVREVWKFGRLCVLGDVEIRVCRYIPDLPQVEPIVRLGARTSIAVALSPKSLTKRFQ